MASNEVFSFNLYQGRFFVNTSLVSIRTPCMEPASTGRINRARNLPADNILGPFRLWIRNRNGGDQSLGVGMQRPIDDIQSPTKFHHLPQIQYSDAIRDMLGESDVV